MHGQLEPWQRRLLLSEVRAKMPGWSARWNDAGAAPEHPWVLSIATEHLEKSEADTVATARRWADALVAETRTNANAELDDATRRGLRVRLRRANAD